MEDNPQDLKNPPDSPGADQPDLTVIPIPREYVNDDTALITEFLVEEGGPVEAGQDILCFEISKGTITLSTPAAGFVHFLVPLGAEVPVGQAAAVVSSRKGGWEPAYTIEENEAQETGEAGALPGPEPAGAGNALRLSRGASELLAARGLSPERLGLGGMVRTADVLAALDRAGGGEPARGKGAEAPGTMGGTEQDKEGKKRKPISRTKEAEIRFLRAANGEAILSQVSVLVPSQGLLRKAGEDPDMARQFSGRILFEVSRLLPRYPDLLSVYEEGVWYQYGEINLGYALCIDRGLQVPVFRDCNRLSLEAILRQKDAFVERYLDRTLSPADLEGGTFTVSDLSSAGAWLFNPVLNYRQTAILGVGGEDPRGEAYPLILAFDHRAADGMTALSFLNELKQRMQSHGRVLLGPSPAGRPPQDRRETDLHPAKDPTNGTNNAMPFCTKCYRDAAELTGMDHYLVQTVDQAGEPQLVCTICLSGW